MENREFYEPSRFRVFTLILTFVFLLYFGLTIIPDYLEDSVRRIVAGIIVTILVTIISALLYSFFRIKELPPGLNDLLALFIIGGVIEVVLYLILPVLALIFGGVYFLFFISKVDENNKILYNRL